MTREEAIQILADLTDNLFLHTWEKQNKALHMAIEALSAEADWIPVSERLPEVGEICLLTVHEYGWNCKEYTRVIIGEYSDNYADHILAWMPLPKPYKGGDSE